MGMPSGVDPGLLDTGQHTVLAGSRSQDIVGHNCHVSVVDNTSKWTWETRGKTERGVVGLRRSDSHAPCGRSSRQ